MKIYPAIDIKGGQVVRLRQGDYAQVDTYATNPVDIALDFEKKGATHLHVVDLDGAKDDTLANYHVICDIRANTSLFIEVGGGIRDEERIAKYIDAGINRVILGTIALENPAFVAEMVQHYGEKIAVGVDAKNGKVAIKGWLEIADQDAFAFCQTMQSCGVATIIYTDISKDGMMEGSNLSAYQTLCEQIGCDIIASGGVSTLAEIEILRSLGVAGVIVGKALYEGNLSLSDVLLYE